MESVWENVELPRFHRLKGDVHTDVLIIGGGMAGILTAYMLEKNGVKYMLAEKDRICSKTTKNTTAKITIQHGLIYQKLVKSSGVNAAQKYLRANKAALNYYAKMAANIDCDFEIKDNYVYSVHDKKKLEKEMDALCRIGYTAEICKKIPIPVKNVGAIKFSSQAQFNPLKFIAHTAKDLNIYENTFVKGMEGNTAVTDNGKIFAKKVIVTTHFPFINKHGSYFLKLYQHRSYVIALENAQDVDGMYVDEDHAGLSFRNYGDLLLLGGGGHRTGKKGGDWREIREYANLVYPDSIERFSYAAQDCMSLDDIPYIGRYSKSTSDLYVASGFNKWGMTGSMVAAMILSDMVSGRKNEFANVFDPSRNMLKKQLLFNGVEATVNLLTPSKKRCPHLGCALKWNPAEHSWDCPCHGSRFEEDGRVLDNPANGDLHVKK